MGFILFSLLDLQKQKQEKYDLSFQLPSELPAVLIIKGSFIVTSSTYSGDAILVHFWTSLALTGPDRSHLDRKALQRSPVRSGPSAGLRTISPTEPQRDARGARSYSGKQRQLPAARWSGFNSASHPARTQIR